MEQPDELTDEQFGKVLEQVEEWIGDGKVTDEHPDEDEADEDAGEGAE